ncbi:hypothetical protein [Agrobacterium tumefaciens]|uniref:hypothetical protein n=1 Tax=Agrobacterium tumefaciens TaxID=358 RepID=UPI0016592C41|nr:hypothetical protein [Agrobacterium tumefaciens]QNP80987.1 hypothetical protein IAI05_07045 [Agrobacterium tumefaciens]
MDDLIKQAKELDITVDPNWSQEDLQKKIDEALAKPAKAGKPAKAESKPKEAKGKLFPVVLLKNYRPVGKFKIADTEDGERDPDEQEVNKVPAGKTILIGVDEAKTVIAKKIGERADAIG